ncbi:MAG: TatD family hydrolase [Bacillota bacterium]
MTQVPLVDTHLHLDDQRFEDDREQVLRRALDAGVSTVVTCGADLATSRQALALAERYGETEGAGGAAVWAAVGIHPHEAGQVGDVEAALRELQALASHPRVVAIGEIGLDYHYDFSPRKVQLELFRRQLHLAASLGKAAIVHAREAEDDVLAILGRERPSRGVMHAFAGSLEQARRALDLGWYVGVGGMLTFHNADGIREVAASVPLDRILLETDAPYLAPVPHRGRRNEPAYVALVARKLAEVRGLPVDEVARVTTAAARRLFGLGA